MRHFDTVTAHAAQSNKAMENITGEIRTRAHEALWPKPAMEEWRRSAVPSKVAVPGDYAETDIRWEVSPEDEDSVEVSIGIHEESAALLLNDINDRQTLLDYEHRENILSELPNSVTVRVRPGRELNNPVLLRYAYNGNGRRYDAHTFVFGGDESKARIIEIHEGIGGNSFVTAGAHIQSGQASHIDHIVLQNVSDATVFVYQAFSRVERDSAYRCFEGQFGSSVAKSRITADCTGPGADVKMNGVYTSYGKQKKDVKPVQRHSSPRCSSRSFYKGVVQGDGSSVFQGIIEVAEGAFETDAYLSNKNLLLNDGARADSIPNLEILNNNVKCSHGSTTGTLNEDELFYLQARGISREEGRRMLIEAYFENALGMLDEGPAREEVYAALAQFMKNWEGS